MPEHFELVEQAIGTPEHVDLLGRRPRRFRSRRSNMSWQPEPPALVPTSREGTEAARVAMECVVAGAVDDWTEKKTTSGVDVRVLARKRDSA